MAECEGESPLSVLLRDLDVGGDRSPLPSMWPPVRLLVVLLVLLDEERVVLPVGGRYPQLEGPILGHSLPSK